MGKGGVASTLGAMCARNTEKECNGEKKGGTRLASRLAIRILEKRMKKNENENKQAGEGETYREVREAFIPSLGVWANSWHRAAICSDELPFMRPTTGSCFIMFAGSVEFLTTPRPNPRSEDADLDERHRAV